ncbi:MAG: response regulator [Verrucomicrobiae bacterium]|nr:response regulator [Verrucomicrobiae bacterium]
MKTILLVDDDNDFRETLGRVLARAGYEVRQATNGREAVASYREAPSDLVITDLIMPEREGIETILELRRLQPEVRVIAISGGGRVGPGDYLRMAQSLGAQRTLSKPFPSDQLLKAIEEVLAG